MTQRAMALARSVKTSISLSSFEAGSCVARRRALAATASEGVPGLPWLFVLLVAFPMLVPTAEEAGPASMVGAAVSVLPDGLERAVSSTNSSIATRVNAVSKSETAVSRR